MELVNRNSDGKLDGIQELYHSNGVLCYRYNCINGDIVGNKSVYHSNGVLYYSVNYKDGKKDGECNFYDSDGVLSHKFNYKDGMLHGIQVNYKVGYSCEYYKDEIVGLV